MKTYNKSSYKENAIKRAVKEIATSQEALKRFRNKEISYKEFDSNFHCEKIAMRVDFNSITNLFSNGFETGKLVRIDGNWDYFFNGCRYLGTSIMNTYKIVYYLSDGSVGIAKYSYNCLNGIDEKGWSNDRLIKKLYDVEGMKVQWDNASTYRQKKLKDLWSYLFIHRAPFIKINDFICNYIN